MWPSGLLQNNSRQGKNMVARLRSLLMPPRDSERARQTGPTAAGRTHTEASPWRAEAASRGRTRAIASTNSSHQLSGFRALTRHPSRIKEG
ncbi:hypothetical protein NDU88_003462 [Pleurodeles waltl]|uniref:Uncharacterized protein n=1 Tax=Pleurodeles waltl TaxID=8319 RepID=A0AAV7LIL7_PLEWA|nr:hypothetical protein NDU88_003462 [Pleurodeles waltl]